MESCRFGKSLCDKEDGRKYVTAADMLETLWNRSFRVMHAGVRRGKDDRTHANPSWRRLIHCLEATSSDRDQRNRRSAMEGPHIA